MCFMTSSVDGFNMLIFFFAEKCMRRVKPLPSVLSKSVPAKPLPSVSSISLHSIFSSRIRLIVLTLLHAYTCPSP